MSSKSGPEAAAGAADAAAADKPRPARLSLATRWTLWYALSCFAIVLAAMALLYLALAQSLDRDHDQFLSNKVEILRDYVKLRADDAAALNEEVEEDASEGHYVQVLARVMDERGATVAESNGMAGKLPPAAFPPATAADRTTADGVDNESLQGITFRAMAAEARTARGTTWTVQVAMDSTGERRLLALYRNRIYIVLASTLVAGAAVGRVIAMRGLRHINQVTRAAEKIDSSTLHERINARGLPIEVAQLAAKFNTMLDRLQDSFERLSRFSADIAHELRTPVNNLRGQVEVALQRPRPAEEYQAALASALEEGVRLTRIIDTLLFLARAEEPAMQLKLEEVDLSAEGAAIRDFYHPAAAEAGVDLHLAGAPSAVARVDRTLFQRAIANLVENSLAHTPAGGSVEVRVEQSAGDTMVRIADTGCGIAPEHLAHITDRFYRVDSARTGRFGRVGLGLSIVKSIVTLHGGTVRFESEVGKGTQATIRIPAGRNGRQG